MKNKTGKETRAVIIYVSHFCVSLNCWIVGNSNGDRTYTTTLDTNQ